MRQFSKNRVSKCFSTFYVLSLTFENYLCVFAKTLKIGVSAFLCFWLFNEKRKGKNI